MFDPFGDYHSRGYLRNLFGEKNLETVKDLEISAFKLNIDAAINEIASREINYKTFKFTHRSLFESIYPWAGEDRASNAPDIAIAKAGYEKMFCHPKSVKIASEYALKDFGTSEFCPGTCFSGLAHAHPFLDGNGRTILTFHSEIMRRTEKHVEWEKTNKDDFLTALTNDLNNPDQGFFADYLNPYIKTGALELVEIGERLRSHIG